MKDECSASGWPMVEVAEIADHCLGKMLDQNKNKGTLRPYLRNLNVRWFDFDLSDVLDMRFEDHEVDRYQARKGDLVICEGGYPGRAAIWESEEPMFLQKALHRVRFHEPGHAKWFLYWLHFNDLNGSLADAFSGTGIQHFTKAALSRFRFPLPKLEEQKRIVAVLDQAFAALDRARIHAEANLADAKALFDVVVESKFSARTKWQSEELGSRVRFIDYRGKTPPKSETGVRLITAKNVRMGFVKAEPQEFVPEAAYADWMTRGFPRRGDVLFTTEAPLANVAQLDSDERVVIGQRLITMQTDPDQIDTGFLKWALLSPQMQNDILAQGTGATVQGIKASLLKKIALYLPADVELQKQVAESCEVAFAMKGKLELQYSKKMEDIADLRQSLLQKAFSGQLT